MTIENPLEERLDFHQIRNARKICQQTFFMDSGQVQRISYSKNQLAGKLRYSKTCLMGTPWNALSPACRTAILFGTEEVSPSHYAAHSIFFSGWI